ASRERLRQQLRIPLYRNALYLIISQAITALFGLVFWILAARFYLAEDVGLASAAISAMMLLTMIGTLGLDYALIRFLPSSGKSSNAMINSCLTIGGLASIIIALIFIAGLSVWSPALLFLRQDPVFLCAFVIFTATSTLYRLVSRTFIAERKADFTLIQNIIFTLLRLNLVILLAAFFATFGIFASWGIGQTVALGVAIFIFLRWIHPDYRPLPMIKRAVLGEIMHFSFANYIAALLWFAPIFILPLMVVNLVGAEANAYFYIAWAIATVLFSVPLSTSFSLFAEGSYDEQTLGQNTRRSLVFTFAIVVPAILLIILIGDKLLLLFNPAYAENATSLLRVLAISALPVSLNNIYFGVKRVEM
ncbi:MAG: oligosaccharide flippase family protein, partial [Dehalococcoidia bacterium]|nr:oligosaccharide flippase family protein [Dehalococcoidia bacterium]